MARSHQTSNSSPAEAIPRDRPHQNPPGVKQRDREATQNEGKRRKVASPDQPQPATPLSLYSSDSKESESQGTPPREDDLDAHDEHSASANAPARNSTEATPSTSGMLPCSWTSSPRDHEGERPESLYSVDEERDDSFTSVLDSIKRVNNLEKPAGVTPSQGRTTVALRRGLQSEPSPELHLPPPKLLKALIGDVSSTLDEFVEAQTPNAVTPPQMKRQRRYYRTSEPVLSVPYAVPPGLVLLTLDKAAELKKRPVTIPHSLVSVFEMALSEAGEAVSWLDWWLATISGLGDSQSEETRAEFQRLVVSGSKVLEFLGSQTISALSNLTLLRRDSLLAGVRSSVPPEELSRLRHGPLPTSSALFPPGHLDTALSKARAASNDALVHKALHPPRIPKRQPQGQNRLTLTAVNPANRSGTSPLVPRQQQSSRHRTPSAPSSGGKGDKSRKGKRPFRQPPGHAGSGNGKRKGSTKRSA